MIFEYIYNVASPISITNIHEENLEMQILNPLKLIAFQLLTNFELQSLHWTHITAS